MRKTDTPIYSIVILASIGFVMLLRMYHSGVITFGQFLIGMLGLAVGLGISHGIISVITERKSNGR